MTITSITELTAQERRLRNRIVRRAVELDRLEEAYAQAGDAYNARCTALEADALWSQAQDLVAGARARAK